MKGIPRVFAAILLIFFAANVCESHRILGLFPHPGLSHFHFFHPVMKALAEAGHDVTVVSQFPNKEPIENYTDESMNDEFEGLQNFMNLEWFEHPKPYDHLLEVFMLAEWGINSCNSTINSIAIKNILNQGRREPFDLVIVEQFNSDCMLGVAKLLNAPIIGLSSCNIMPWHFPKIGLPYEPSFYPTTFIGASDRMTSFWKRLSNWFTFVYMNTAYKLLTEKRTANLLSKRFGDDHEKIGDLPRKVAMTFVNQHYSLSGAKHLSPNVVELGGIHIAKAQPLDAELQHFLDSAKHGVIYVSYGSMVRADTLPEEKREAFLHAFGKFKQKVLWKWENETMPNKPSNVFIRKWLPQRDILCHPNVLVFMTHGGLLGSSEAAYCGVPTISTPFYGDQFLNSAAMEERGMGVVLKYQNMNKDSIFLALRKALDEKMREKAKEVSFSYKHRPMTPKQSAVYWAEYVIKTKGAKLTRPHSGDAHWFIYSMLDIYLFLLVCIIAILTSWILLLKRFFKVVDKKPDKMIKTSSRGVSLEKKFR